MDVIKWKSDAGDSPKYVCGQRESTRGRFQLEKLSFLMFLFIFSVLRKRGSDERMKHLLLVPQVCWGQRQNPVCPPAEGSKTGTRRAAEQWEVLHRRLYNLSTLKKENQYDQIVNQMEPKFQQDEANIEDPALCLIDILLQRCKNPSFFKSIYSVVHLLHYWHLQ